MKAPAETPAGSKLESLVHPWLLLSQSVRLINSFLLRLRDLPADPCPPGRAAPRLPAAAPHAYGCSGLSPPQTRRQKQTGLRYFRPISVLPTPRSSVIEGRCWADRVPAPAQGPPQMSGLLPSRPMVRLCSLCCGGRGLPYITEMTKTNEMSHLTAANFPQSG